MTENGVFYYGQDKIDYEVVRKEATYKEKINKPESDKLIAKKAKPRKVVIKVHPDQRVVATAPNDATDEVIHDAMMKRARWIWQSYRILPNNKIMYCPSVMSAAKPSFIWVVVTC
ncbi:hypothetical protein [Psychrobacter sp. JCM 18901]|uniref:hypothetical protein n=1 Tax=Psychrobacter sp. JCM 18901 TaxID=1298609 RepID=UPI0004BBE57B